jgi:hypothetical protein
MGKKFVTMGKELGLFWRGGGGQEVFLKKNAKSFIDNQAVTKGR